MTLFPNRSKPDPVATLPSTYSVHEFHNYGFQGTGISPGLHFHLSGTINALTDIPLGTIHMLRNFLKEDGGGVKKVISVYFSTKLILVTETRQKLDYDLQGKYLAYTSNNLTNFEYKTHAITGNGDDLYFLKIFVKSQ